MYSSSFVELDSLALGSRVWRKFCEGDYAIRNQWSTSILLFVVVPSALVVVRIFPAAVLLDIIIFCF